MRSLMIGLVVSSLLLLSGCVTALYKPNPPEILMTPCPDFEVLPERQMMPSEIVDQWIQDIAVGMECKRTLELLQKWETEH